MVNLIYTAVSRFTTERKKALHPVSKMCVTVHNALTTLSPCPRHPPFPCFPVLLLLPLVGLVGSVWWAGPPPHCHRA